MWTSHVEQAWHATYNSNDKEAINICQTKQNDVLVLLASMTTEEIKQKMKRCIRFNC